MSKGLQYEEIINALLENDLRFTCLYEIPINIKTFLFPDIILKDGTSLAFDYLRSPWLNENTRWKLLGNKNLDPEMKDEHGMTLYTRLSLHTEGVRKSLSNVLKNETVYGMVIVQIRKELIFLMKILAKISFKYGYYDHLVMYHKDQQYHKLYLLFRNKKYTKAKAMIKASQDTLLDINWCAGFGADKLKRPLLHRLCLRNDLEGLQVLLTTASRLNVNKRNETGEHILHSIFAANFYGKPDWHVMFSRLISIPELNINCKSPKNVTPVSMLLARNDRQGFIMLCNSEHHIDQRLSLDIRIQKDEDGKKKVEKITCKFGLKEFVARMFGVEITPKNGFMSGDEWDFYDDIVF